MSAIEVLAPDVFDQEATQQGANVWLLLALYTPAAVQPLALTCMPLWDMLQNVASSTASIGVSVPGFPSEPDPFGLFFE